MGAFGTLVFTGVDGMDCETFLAAARRQIMKEGKYDDGAWISNFIASCFEGPALRWHINLPPAVRNDWYELQKAMLAAWSAPESRDEPPMYPVRMPVPFQAAEVRYGRIRLLLDGDNREFYVSNKLTGWGGSHIATTKVSDALLVRLSPSDRPYAIELLNAEHKWLGGYWDTPERPNVLQGSSAHAHVVQMNALDAVTATECSNAKGGFKSFTNWEVSPDDRVWASMEDKAGVRQNLEFVVAEQNPGWAIAMAVDYDAFTRRWPTWSRKAQLFFSPL